MERFYSDNNGDETNGYLVCELLSFKKQIFSLQSHHLSLPDSNTFPQTEIQFPISLASSLSRPASICSNRPNSKLDLASHNCRLSGTGNCKSDNSSSRPSVSSEPLPALHKDETLYIASPSRPISSTPIQIQAIESTSWYRSNILG